jgi:hypothetical protein
VGALSASMVIGVSDINFPGDCSISSTPKIEGRHRKSEAASSNYCRDTPLLRGRADVDAVIVP